MAHIIQVTRAAINEGWTGVGRAFLTLLGETAGSGYRSNWGGKGVVPGPRLLPILCIPGTQAKYMFQSGSRVEKFVREQTPMKVSIWAKSCQQGLL